MLKRIVAVGLFAVLCHCADSYRGDVPPGDTGAVDGGPRDPTTTAPSPPAPSELTLAPLEDVILSDQGASTSVPITITRSAPGPVTVTAADLPAGVAVAPVTIGAGETTGTLVFALSSKPTLSPTTIRVTAADAAGANATQTSTLLVRGAPGTFDTSFGSGGSTSSLYGNESVLAVDVAPLGARGYELLADKTSSILSQLSLRGVIAAPVSLGFVGSGAIAAQGGKVLVGGIDTDRSIFVRRYSPEGALDATFAAGGLALGTAPARSDGAVRDFLVGPDGALVLYRTADGGYIDGFSFDGAATSRVRVSSTPENNPLSFGRVGDGVVSFLSALGGARYFVQTITAGGTGTVSNTRIDANDPLDATPPLPRGATGAGRAYLPFSRRGSVTSATSLIAAPAGEAPVIATLDTSTGQPAATVVQADGKIIVAYADGRSVNVVRYVSEGGTRDATFGTNGMITLSFRQSAKDVGRIRIYALPENRLLAFVNTSDANDRTIPSFCRLWL